LEKDIISEWQISEHTHEREQHWHRINALSSVKEDLEALIDSAKIEEKGDTQL
jgi:adenosyl cobinamide kinase/adenosyl cobinamide phosphate guanylyltransferase